VTLYAEIAGGDGRPSAGSAARLADIERLLDRQLAALNQIFAGDLAAFNKLVKSKGNDPVVLPK